MATFSPEVKIKRLVAFTTDKHGRPIAYRTYPGNWRWFRMAYDEAKLAVATGLADEIPYRRIL